MSEKLSHTISTPDQHGYRYPGVTPFTTEQSNIFYGRTQDTEKLYKLIRREQITVLFGKSGLGKSSLINAGIIRKCIDKKTFNPINIRFNAWDNNASIPPLVNIKKQLSKKITAPSFIDHLLPEDDSLWLYLKKIQLAVLQQGNTFRPLLVFDQFEELFSYPEHEIDTFLEELSELIQTSIPLRFRRMIDSFEFSGELTEEQEEQEDRIETELGVRVLIAIRSDKIQLLDKLKPEFPNILRNTHKLEALALEDAKAAIITPANQKGNFKTNSFTFTSPALNKLLQFLQEPSDRKVEGILLQMLCEYYERNKVEKNKLTLLDIGDIGNPNEVIKTYYADKITSLPKDQQKAASLLIEEGLVSDGDPIRLSLHESYIKQEFGIEESLLVKLVDLRLLRSEPFTRGGYTYELSHDRLIEAVIEARNKRREEKSTLALLEQKKKLRRARTRAILASILALIAIGLAIWAFSLRTAALASEARAQQLKEKADARRDSIVRINNNLKKTEGVLQDQLTEVQKTRDAAQIAQLEAELASIEAKNQQLAAEAARDEVNLQKVRVDSLNKNLSIQNKTIQLQTDSLNNILEQLAQQNRELALTLLDESKDHIYTLEYDKAFEKYNLALELADTNLAPIQLSQELAFFFFHTQQNKQLSNLLQTLKYEPPNISSHIDSLIILPLDNKHYQTLVMRYFPEFIFIQGGTFLMGCLPDRDDSDCEGGIAQYATVDNFYMSTTEITNWQFHLFSTINNITMTPPSYGFKGDHPVSYIDPQKGMSYCNWLSQKLGLEEIVYTNDLYNFNNQTNSFRLPTEAEWEYAARGGQNFEDFKYSGSNSIQEVAWYAGNSKDQVHKIKEKKANSLGLFDLSGNIAEWSLSKHINIRNDSINRPINRNSFISKGSAFFNSEGNSLIISNNVASPEQPYRGTGLRIVLPFNGSHFSIFSFLKKRLNEE